MFLIALPCLASLSLHAQERRWNVALQSGAGYIMNTFDTWDDMLATHIFPSARLKIGYQTCGNDSPYAALWGYPNIGLAIGWQGLSLLQYKGESHFENLVNFHGFFERDIIRNENFSFGYEFQLGMGFNRSLYNASTNPLNMNFSSPLLIFIGGDIYAKYRLSKHLEAGFALHVGHYSTGRLALPNNGINETGVSVSLRYNNLTQPHRGKTSQKDLLKRRLYGEIYTGGGLHRCTADWRAFGTSSPWPIFVYGANIYYRYLPHISTGFELDWFNAADIYLERMEQGERVLYGDEAVDAYGQYNELSWGASILQQFHYGNFTAFGAVGMYFHNHMGLHEQEGPLYQKAGIKYSIPKLGGLFVAVDCKAHHFSRAQMMEFTIGMRL